MGKKWCQFIVILFTVLSFILSTGCTNSVSVETVVEKEPLLAQSTNSTVEIEQTPMQPTVPLEFNVDMETWFETESYEGESETLEYTIEVQYPSVSEMKDVDLQTRINKAIYNDIALRIQAFKADLNWYRDPSYQRDCKIDLLTNDYISVVYDGNTYNGGSRPFQFAEYFTIDMKTGKPMELSDFFVNSIDDGATLLMRYCKEDLIQQYEEYYGEKITEQFLWLLDSGVTLETCSRGSLTPTAFHLIFDDLFSNAEGCWEVYVPYEALGDKCILNK